MKVVLHVAVFLVGAVVLVGCSEKAPTTPTIAPQDSGAGDGSHAKQLKEVGGRGIPKDNKGR